MQLVQGSGRSVAFARLYYMLLQSILSQTKLPYFIDIPINLVQPWRKITSPTTAGEKTDTLVKDLHNTGSNPWHGRRSYAQSQIWQITTFQILQKVFTVLKTLSRNLLDILKYCFCSPLPHQYT